MGENERDIFLHDWVIDEIKFQYSKEFNEIQINKHGVEVNDIQGQFPDIIFANYGQVVMLGEVEVESTINDNSIEKWKNNMSTGISLILFVPKEKLKLVRDMFWENKLIEKIKVSSFSVEIPIK